MKLLDDYLVLTPPAATPTSTILGCPSCSPDTVLALARHAARLDRAPKCNPEFPVRVHSERVGRAKGLPYFRPDEFDNCPVERFLDEGPFRAVLIGLPGAGKSYSLQQAAARLAEKLHESCLSDTFDEELVVVPLLADLKLYHGDLDDLINRTLPHGLSLCDLSRRCKVKVYLDSFNEMPREYWESGSYEADFAKVIASNANASFIIGSRTSDGLSKVGFPFYRLDQIDEGFVTAELERLKIDVGGRFQREVRTLLQNPFYFQLVASRTVRLPEQPHPRDFYQTFFTGLTRSFQERFGQSFNVEYALSLAAYEAINRGEEAQPLADVLQILGTQLEGAGVGTILAADVANWLVSKSVVIPYRGARIAFFHQSATEYLAASELARRYKHSPQILKEKLSLRRWDQALFLTLSLLLPNDSATFLQAVVDADFALALAATKYLEFERDVVVAKLLSEIPSRLEGLGQFETQIESAVEFGLALSDVHEPQLRALMKCGNVIGAAAVTRLVELKDVSIKDELLQSLLESRGDFNYCVNGIASALQPLASPEDAQKIAVLADSIKDEVLPDIEEDVADGFMCGASIFLSSLDARVIRRAFLPQDQSEPLTEIKARILCYILYEQHSTDALELAADLITRGVDRAATPIYLISRSAKPDDNLSWATFSLEHVDRLVSMLGVEKRDVWSLQSLRSICHARPDLAQAVRAHALSTRGIARAALLHCASTADPKPVFEALAELAEIGVEERGQQPTHLLQRSSSTGPDTKPYSFSSCGCAKRRSRWLCSLGRILMRL